MCNNLVITRYELIEVQVDALVAGKYTFPSAISTLQDNPERAIYIQDVEIFPNYAQARSVKTPAVVGVPPVDLPNFSVTFYYDGADFIRNIPAPKLVYTVPPAGVAAPYQWNRVPFNDLYPVAIDQCFLTFTAAPSTVCVVPIGVTYLAVKKVK